MKKSLIFLRSFGDFAMSISILRKSTISQDWIFYASKHLEPLYSELKPFLPELSLNIEFIDLEIKNNVLGYFTNRHSIEWHSMIELLNVKKALKGLEGEIHFEQKRKQWFVYPVLGKFYPYIHDNKINIYESFCRKFNVRFEDLIFEPVEPVKKVLILPESRKPSKAFPHAFVHDLETSFKKRGIEVSTAFFKKKDVTSYHSFTELINLIKSSDHIVTADSLPAHLAQMFHKSHFIYYENKMNWEWITPFSRANNAFGRIGENLC